MGLQHMEVAFWCKTWHENQM